MSKLDDLVDAIYGMAMRDTHEKTDKYRKEGSPKAKAMAKKLMLELIDESCKKDEYTQRALVDVLPTLYKKVNDL